MIDTTQDRDSAPYLYDAFISYRSVEPDRTIGLELHRFLENFRTPSSLVRTGIPQRLKRVFRDQAELAASADLSADLCDALYRSRFLIVVCSPNTRQSPWIAKEIDVFRKLHGDRRVLLLLVEGEPEESFPAPFLGADAAPNILAADVRAPALRQSVRRLKTTEALRLLAPILGVKFDDLLRRQRRRQIQRLAAGTTTSLAILIAIAGLALFSANEKRSRELMSGITRLAEASLQSSEVGDTGTASQFAVLAHGLDPQGRLGKQAQVYAALRRSLTSTNRNQIVSRTNARPTALATTADGYLVAIGREDGSVEVLDLMRPSASVATTRFDGAIVKGLAFLADGRGLVVGRDDGEVWMLTLGGESLTRSLLGRCPTVMSLAASPAGRLVAVGTEEDGVCILDLERVGSSTRRDVAGIVRSITFSRDGAWLAAGRKGGIEVWAASKENISARSITLQCDSDVVTAVAFGREHLAAASHTEFGSSSERTPAKLRLWRSDSFDGPQIRRIEDADRVQSIAFSSKGEIVATASTDGKIALWVVDRGSEPLRQLLGHQGGVVSVAFAGADVLLSTGDDLSVRAWRTSGPPDTTIPTSNAVLSLAFIDSDRLVGAERLAQRPHVWRVQTSHLLPLKTPVVSGTTLVVVNDVAAKGRFAFGTGFMLGETPDASVRIWNIFDRHFPIEPVLKHRSDVDALALSDDGRWLASAGRLDRTLTILDRRTDDVRTIDLPRQVGAVRVLAFQPKSDAPLLAIGGDVVAILGRDWKTEAILQVPGQGQAAVTSGVSDLEFGPDGKLLAVTAPSGGLALWRSGGWDRPQSILQPVWTTAPSGATQIAFNPVTADLAAGYADGAIRVWHPPDYRAPLLVRAPSGGAVQSLSFDGTGVMLAAGLAQGGIEILSTLNALVDSACSGSWKPLSRAEWLNAVGSAVEPPNVCKRRVVS